MYKNVLCSFIPNNQDLISTYLKYLSVPKLALGYSLDPEKKGNE